MRTKSLLLGAVASLALTGAANAREINGWYVGIEGGGNWIDDVDWTGIFDPDAAGANVPDADVFSFDAGWAALASVGYGFGGNWRAELEAGYRSNETDQGLAADVSEWSAMVNVLYDFHLTPQATLSLGAGAGADFAQLKVDAFAYDADDWNLAYQGLAGIAYALSDNLDLTLTYRYLRISEPEFDGRTIFPGPGTIAFAFDDVVKHTATIGLRYAFGAAPASAPMAEYAPPPPAPPAQVARQFIIFFGFNKCNITSEADGLLGQAADAAKQTGSASITITGHTDTSGSTKANQKLSECRANAAKSNLIGKGISASSIHAIGKGEGELLVQTADGVKEPQNRRAQVDLE
jgi:OmpA-OmpF porin, OOP family